MATVEESSSWNDDNEMDSGADEMAMPSGIGGGIGENIEVATEGLGGMGRVDGDEGNEGDGQ